MLGELVALVTPILAGAPLPQEWIDRQDDSDAFARAWEACTDARAQMSAFALAETDLRPVVRVALGCARTAAAYELASPSPVFAIAEALATIDRWIEITTVPSPGTRECVAVGAYPRSTRNDVTRRATLVRGSSNPASA